MSKWSPGPRCAVLYTLLAVASMLVASQVEASDEGQPTLAERATACKAAIVKHKRARDSAALCTDVQSALVIYQEAAKQEGSDALQTNVVKLVGALSRYKCPEVRCSVLKALGTMGHEAGASYVKRYLKPVKTTRPRDYKATLEAIDAAGQIAHSSLVRPLVVVVDKSKNNAAAAKALRALGKFRDCKRQRCKILTDLMKSLRPDMPGRAAPGKENESTGQYIPGKSGSPGTSRWGSLSPVLVEAFNELTGQHIMSAEDWFQYVMDNRQSLQSIFRDDA